MNFLHRAFAVLALLGFCASVICHVMGWLQLQPPGGESVFVLHIGIFVIGFSLIFFSRRTASGTAKNRMRRGPVRRWVRQAIVVLFAYTIINFVYFTYCSNSYPKDEAPPYVRLRGFSGHWMFFYAAMAVELISLARSTL